MLLAAPHSPAISPGDSLWESITNRCLLFEQLLSPKI